MTFWWTCNTSTTPSYTGSTFDSPGAENLVGLWEFAAGGETTDTGLSDGIAQNGTKFNGAYAQNDALRLDGYDDHFDTSGDDAPFDLSSGTIQTQFTQFAQVGTSPDTIVSRGEYCDKDTEGYFNIQVTADGAVTVYHEANGTEISLSTGAGFFNEGDSVRVSYTWDENGEGNFIVENTTTGATSDQTFDSTGLTMDIGDNDDENFTFGAREYDDGAYDQYFNGAIDYVAIFDQDMTDYAADGDGIVEGTSGDDLIDLAYTGDPEGDMIDAGDARLPGEVGDDDIVHAGAGDDTVYAGEGNDEVYGDRAGTDVSVTHETFQWSELPDTDHWDGSTVDNGEDLEGRTFTQDTGSVTVTVSTPDTYTQYFPWLETDVGVDTSFSTTTVNTDGLDGADTDSSIKSLAKGGETGTYNVAFSEEVNNVTFNVSDIDANLGQVTVTAYDADGNVVPVVFDAGSELTVMGNTVTSANTSNVTPSDDSHTVTVSIEGPVSRLEITHSNPGSGDSGIHISDIGFDLVEVTEGVDGAGNDTLFGEEGDDALYGEAGNDTLDGGIGDDLLVGGAGSDTLDGGEGNDTLIGDSPTETVTQNLIVNGSFEDTSGMSTTSYGFTATGEIVGWTSEVPETNDIDVHNDGRGSVNATDGANWLDLAGTPGNLTIGQDVDGVIDGETYHLEFDAGDHSDYANQIEVYWGGELIDTIDPVNGGMSHYEYDLTGGAGDGSNRLEFRGTGVEDNYGASIDNVSLVGPTLIETGDGAGDTLIGGAGDDVMLGQTGDDSFVYTDGQIGNDTVTGGEDGETNGDVIDATAVTTDTTVILSAPEAGTFEAEGDTVTFEEIEQVHLGSGDDTVIGSDGDDTISTGAGADTVDMGAGDDTVDFGADDDVDTAILGDGFGNDTLENFKAPETDPVTGDVTGFDQVDVSGLHDGEGNPVDTDDVTVSEDPEGNAVLTFPNGETLTLVGVSIDQVDTPEELHAMGIPMPAPMGDGIVEGTSGNDLIDTAYLGDPEGDLVDAGDALLPGEVGDDDIIEAYEGDDTVYAGEGNDEIDAGAGDDTVFAGNGDDAIVGGAGDDTLNGEAGNDTITDSDGSETVDGGTGDDYIDVAGGNSPDTIAELLALTNPNGLSDLDYSPYSPVIPVDSAPSDDIDTVIGGDGNDTIITGDDADYIEGGAGNDTIYAGIDDDTVLGGDGNDYIEDVHGADYIDGGAGDDTIIAGFDTFSDYAGDDPALPNPAYPYASDQNTVDGMDTVYGGDGNDTILTGDDADYIDGGTGHDIIDAGIDDDVVFGGTGDDQIIGGHGSDVIHGGEGDDVIQAGDVNGVMLHTNEDDSTDPVPTNDMDTVYGGAGNDVITGGDDDDTIYGGDDNDFIDGGLDDDTLFGDAGDDTILGGQGNDVIDAGAGFDTVDGGEGSDTIYGGGDNDVLSGGADNDTIYVTSTGAPGGSNNTTVHGGSAGLDWDTLNLSALLSAGWVITAHVQNPDSDGNGFDGQITLYQASTGETANINYTNIEEVIPCFTPGTLIATPKGEVPVETLKAGDKVITRDNGIQTIRWVGAKTLSAADLAARPMLKPVTIRAGALGNGLPERDMTVSPNHRMLVVHERAALLFDDHEVLVAAKHLTRLDGVEAAADGDVTYIHIMCDRHEVVLSDGTWSESFQPGDYTLDGIGGEAREEIFAIFPELREATGRGAFGAARRILKKHEAELLTV